MLDLRDVVVAGRAPRTPPVGGPRHGHHRLAAHVRVFLTGSYKPPREFNWVVGVMLLLLTLLLSFTGYLLPWDQLAIWAVTVARTWPAPTPLWAMKTLAQVLTVDGRDLINQFVGRPFCPARGPLRRRGHAQPVLRVALRCDRGWRRPCLQSLHFWRVRKDGGIRRPL